MAVKKLKAKKVVEYFLPMVQRELITPYVISRLNGDDFKGAKGDTINLKVKGLSATARDYDFRGRTGPIVLDDILPDGYSMPFKLNKHIVSATGLEDEHWTLDDIDFATEVLTPQVEAVVKNVDAKALTAFRSASFFDTIDVTADADPHLVTLEAKRLMDAQKVAPRTGRFHFIGSDIAAAWVASDRLSKYESTGQEGTPALRESIIGRLNGSPVVEHSGLDPDEGYYLHKSALYLATVAPSIPKGAVTGKTYSKDGMSARWIQDYDANYLRDRSIVSMFAGVNEVRDERNPDGTWMFEEGDFDEEELDFYGIEAGDVHPVGTRKNVRVLKYNITGTGSVL